MLARALAKLANCSPSSATATSWLAFAEDAFGAVVAAGVFHGG
jgi:hypothetical protein